MMVSDPQRQSYLRVCTSSSRHSLRSSSGSSACCHRFAHSGSLSTGLSVRCQTSKKTHDPHFVCRRSLLRESIYGMGVSTMMEVRDSKPTSVHVAQPLWQVVHPRSWTTGLSSNPPPLNCANAYDSLCSYAPEVDQRSCTYEGG